jgi:hypothetical protein
MSIRAISYGGGVQSTAMLVLAAQREIDFPLALFSNVGDDSEHPATLAYFRDYAVPYAAEHGIELVELRKRGRGKEVTLYQRIANPESKTVGIPARLMPTGAPAMRSCTLDFKVRRIASELKQRGASAQSPALVALGISIDEYQRMRTDSGIAWQTLAYPLIDRQLDRAACMGVIERAGLPVPPKSSCYFCPFHTMDVWRKQRRDEPELFAKSVALEKQLSDRHIALGRGPVYMTNAQRPLDEAVGDHDQLDLFETEASCDVAGYCAS